MKVLFASLALAASLSLNAAHYDVDGSHSAVQFKISHLGISNTWGRFNDISGHYNFDEANPSASSVSITIDASSVDTGNAKRDEHLRKPDFFNAKQFPTITFKSSKVSKEGEAFKVEGDLTLHGQTQSITVMMNKVGEGKDPWGNFRSGFSGEFSINRADYGMNYNPKMVGNDVHIYLDFEGILKKADAQSS